MVCEWPLPIDYCLPTAIRYIRFGSLAQLQAFCLDSAYLTYTLTMCDSVAQLTFCKRFHKTVTIPIITKINITLGCGPRPCVVLLIWLDRYLDLILKRKVTLSIGRFTTSKVYNFCVAIMNQLQNTLFSHPSLSYSSACIMVEVVCIFIILY